MSKIGLDINNLKRSEYHYHQCKEIKRYFISNSKVAKYESYKIWASWIITHRSLHDQKDSFIPSIGLEKDLQIVHNLQEKGSSHQQAKVFYGIIINKCIQLVDKLQNVTIDDIDIQLPHDHYDRDGVEIKYLDNDNQMLVRFGAVKHKLATDVFEKLENLYMKSLTTYNFAKNLFVLLNHYALLDGLSFQWAIPPKAYDYLDNILHIKGELFASPMNSLSKRFWSLFEIDKLFGSSGSFFKTSYEDFVKEGIGGVYQVNPPFIENIFIQSSKRIINYLKQARMENVDLMFIYFMPNWLDSFGYRQLKESTFMTDETIISGGSHYYYESTNQKYIKVHFNTHILVLSSTTRMGTRWTPSIKARIKSYFR